MTISTKKPLYAEVHNVPDDYEFTDEELMRCTGNSGHYHLFFF